MDCVDELTQETNKMVNFHRQVAKQQQAKQQYIQKRVKSQIIKYTIFSVLSARVEKGRRLGPKMHGYIVYLDYLRVIGVVYYCYGTDFCNLLIACLPYGSTPSFSGLVIYFMERKTTFVLWRGNKFCFFVCVVVIFMLKNHSQMHCVNHQNSKTLEVATLPSMGNFNINGSQLNNG